MKINFKNKAARLKNERPSCNRCPFLGIVSCQWYTSSIVDCYGKGHWFDGESVDIFRV